LATISGSNWDPADLAVLKEFDFERAACDVLKRAISLQKSIVADTRREQILKLNVALAPGRTALARKLLALVGELNDLADKDRGLTQELSPTEVPFLMPRPCPAGILGADAIAWLREFVEQGFIEAHEMSAVVRLQGSEISLAANPT
jgi:hypothetical protein